jgi:hypothetical protein
VASALSDVPTGSPMNFPADQMRRLLESIKSTDRSTYESVMAKVSGFSPDFALPVKP